MRSWGGLACFAAAFCVVGCSVREDDDGDSVVVDASIGTDGEAELRLDADRPDVSRPDHPDGGRPDTGREHDADASDADVSDASDADVVDVSDASDADSALPDASDADATVIVGCPMHDLGSAIGPTAVATGDTSTEVNSLTPTCSYSSSAPDVSYLWTAPEDGTYSFDSFGSSFDTVLYALDYGAMSCMGASLGCNDDSSGVQSSFRATVTAGQQLILVIDGYSSGSGSYVLNINPSTASETACHDMVDEDRDGYTDCSDSDCSSLGDCYESVCSGGLDEDTDGLIDCEDYDCRYTDACSEICNDGFDNDADGTIDCADYDCSYEEGCRETSCADGADDDGDGTTDCRDYDCNYDAACVETSCNDGVDNDGNGMIDCDEYECYYDTACGEYYCTDGESNDSDGFVDCEDSECRCDPSCVVDTCPGEDLGSAVGLVADGAIVAGDCSTRSSYCGGSAAERLYRWKAPEAGTYTFTATGAGGLDTVLYLLDSCDATYGEEIACNDNLSWESPDKSAVLTTDLVRDQSVIVVVDAYTGNDYGRYQLSVVRQ